MSRSLFILNDPSNEESVSCTASAAAIFKIFIQEAENLSVSKSFPIIEATFFLLHRVGTKRLLELGKCLSEGEELRIPKRAENHIREEVRRLLENPSSIPSREEILASWNLPFGIEM